MFIFRKSALFYLGTLYPYTNHGQTVLLLLWYVICLFLLEYSHVMNAESWMGVAMNAGKTTTLLQSSFNYQERGMTPLLFVPRPIPLHTTLLMTSRHR